MEIEINKEILNYREGVFFGLPLRELVSVLVAVFFSVIAYILFANVLLCAAVSFLPILAGFVTYHGMNGGKAMAVILRDLVSAGHLTGSKSDMNFLREAAFAETKDKKIRKQRKENA